MQDCSAEVLVGRSYAHRESLLLRPTAANSARTGSCIMDRQDSCCLPPLWPCSWSYGA